MDNRYTLAEDLRIPMLEGEVRGIRKCENDNRDYLKRLAKIVQENERSREIFNKSIDRCVLSSWSKININEKQIELLFKENERNVREIGRLNKKLSGIVINRIGIVVNFFLIFCILLFIL